LFAARRDDNAGFAAPVREDEGRIGNLPPFDKPVYVDDSISGCVAG
jgi:hypothetical protein